MALTGLVGAGVMTWKVAVGSDVSKATLFLLLFIAFVAVGVWGALHSWSEMKRKSALQKAVVDLDRLRVIFSNGQVDETRWNDSSISLHLIDDSKTKAFQELSSKTSGHGAQYTLEYGHGLGAFHIYVPEDFFREVLKRARSLDLWVDERAVSQGPQRNQINYTIRPKS